MLFNLIFAWALGAEPLVWGVRAPRLELDPLNASSLAQYDVSNQIFETLYRRDPRTQALRPALATSWRVRGARVRVTLRHDAYFGDGTRLAATDVAYSFGMIFDEAFRAASLRPMFEGVVDVRATDPTHLEFSLRPKSYAALESMLSALRVVKRGWRPGEPANGTGAYRVVRMGEHALLLAANRRWWGRPRAAAELLVKTVNEDLLAEQKLRAGELDIYEPERGAIGEPVAGAGRGVWIDLNLRRSEFADLRVRRALTELWDRARSSAIVFGDRARPALDTFLPELEAYPKGQPIAFSPAAARKNLLASGFGTDHPLSFNLLVQDQDALRWVELYRTDAARVGVRVTTELVSPGEDLWARLREGKFDALAGTGGPNTSLTKAAWTADGFYNFAHVADPELERLVRALDREFAGGARRRLTRAAILRARVNTFAVPGLYVPGRRLRRSPRIWIDPLRPIEAWRWRPLKTAE